MERIKEELMKSIGRYLSKGNRRFLWKWDDFWESVTVAQNDMLKSGVLMEQIVGWALPTNSISNNGRSINLGKLVGGLASLLHTCSNEKPQGKCFSTLVLVGIAHPTTRRKLMDMLARITQHMKVAEDKVKKMPANTAFAFALSCTERQWVVFQRASESVPCLVEWRTSLRWELELAWKHVLSDTDFQVSDSFKRFHEILHSWIAGSMEVEDTDGLSSALAQTIANSMVNLLLGLANSDVSSAHFPAARNFDLLEVLLDENGLLLDDLKEDDRNELPEIASVREAIEKEMQQQNRDLQILETDSCQVGITKLQRISTGKSLFG